MRNIIKIFLVASVICLMTGCTEKETSCCSGKKYPHLDSPYTAPLNTVSWSDFNPIHIVDKYFLYHDSTISEHAGDTIMLYGCISSQTPTVGSYVFRLTASHHWYDGHCGYCFPDKYITLPSGQTVEEWMTQKGKVVFVKGTIKYVPRNPPHRPDPFYGIQAIKVDSVKF